MTPGLSYTPRMKRPTEPWHVLGRIHWSVLIAPVLVGAAFVWLESSGSYHIVKPQWEAGALWILRAAVVVSAVTLAVRRDRFSLWWMALVTILLLREYHFKYTSTGVYVGGAVLLAIAWWQLPRLGDQFGRPVVITGLALVGVCYALSVTLDQNAWDFIPQVAQGETRDTVGQLVEEVMENLGHLVLLGLTVVLALPRRPVDRSAEEA